MPRNSGNRGNGLGPSGTKISNGAVQLFRKYTGRGPSQAQTTLNGDTVLIVLRETLTEAEGSMIAAGFKDVVLSNRRRTQDAMEPELVELVERHVERKVIAFVSLAETDPDIAVEVFELGESG